MRMYAVKEKKPGDRTDSNKRVWGRRKESMILYDAAVGPLILVVVGIYLIIPIIIILLLVFIYIKAYKAVKAVLMQKKGKKIYVDATMKNGEQEQKRQPDLQDGKDDGK